MSKHAFLENLLSKKINDRSTILANIKTNKPSFPPPQKQPSIQEHPDSTPDTHALQPPSTESSTSGNAGTNFIHFTRADDLDAYRDTDEVIATKSSMLAHYIRDAKNVVVFTGAGISTAANLPDYRSKATGLWVLKEQGAVVQPTSALVSGAQPTKSHMAVAKLLEKKLINKVVSTNIDGLHVKSGIPLDDIIELHGNCFVEFCPACKTRVIRDFIVSKGVEESQSQMHDTGRTCNCGGNLRDSVIHFGESIEEPVLRKAHETVLKMDLAIVLGSSMRVSPSCNLPRKALDTPMGKLVVVNLQKTPFEDEIWLHIHATIDEVMSEVMKQLALNDNYES